MTSNYHGEKVNVKSASDLVYVRMANFVDFARNVAAKVIVMRKIAFRGPFMTVYLRSN